MIFKRATLQDIPILVQLGSSELNLGTPQFTTELALSYSYTWILQVPEPVGFMTYWCVAQELQLLNMVVGICYRGRGYGKQLLQKLLEQAAAHHCNLVTLEVRKSNTAARHLYEQGQFTTVGVRRAYYANNNEDAILMERHMQGKDICQKE